MGGRVPSSLSCPVPVGFPGPLAPRPLVHRGPTGWASRPKRLWAPAWPPAVPWGSATVLVPPHGPQPRWDYVCLFICFCLNSDLFHVWFENFQTQKSKKLGRIWCPCLLPAVARGLGPTPLPCGAEASQGDAARASDTGGGCGPCLGGGRGQAGHTSGCAGLCGCGGGAPRSSRGGVWNTWQGTLRKGPWELLEGSL